MREAWTLQRLLIDEAAKGGADAIKFQTYRSHTIASRNSPAYWDTEKEPTESQYKLFKKYDKFWKNEFEELRECCDVSGIEFLSTPFDKESAMFPKRFNGCVQDIIVRYYQSAVY